MATKIGTLAAIAFISGTSFKNGNTQVVKRGATFELLLYGNCIACRPLSSNKALISTCGWNTNTTKDRLNALGVKVSTRKGSLLLNGKPWDGSETSVEL